MSSSALAANVFDQCPGRDLVPVPQALGTTGQAVDLRCERKLLTGARGRAANVDVVLTVADQRLVGIESQRARSEEFGSAGRARPTG